jgi:hypothetical protein
VSTQLRLNIYHRRKGVRKSTQQETGYGEIGQEIHSIKYYQVECMKKVEVG